MRRSRGFTLIEVLASVIILAVAVLMVTYLLQQTTLFSKDNENTDRSVQITQTVMEEIKYKLKTADVITIYGQNLNLKALREAAPPYPAQPILLAYPYPGNAQYEIRISSLPIPDSTFATEKGPVDLAHYFRRIAIQTVHLADNRTFELESYVEFN